ncbi:MAG: discoidin domain-containing protein, partial [Nitrosopumilaceae archaeon]|nr:discoidin domain-containing protein [Nitrosopumilaceae archaeon]
LPSNQPYEKWEDTPGSDDRLNKTTHLSGTTAQMNSTTKWPATTPFWNETDKTWYKNNGTETVPVPVLLSASAEKAVVPLSTTLADYTQPTTATASSLATGAVTETYTTNAGWTQVLTNVTVDSGTPDKVKYAGGTDQEAYVHKSLGQTLGSTWTYDFEFKILSIVNNATTFPVGLTAGTGYMQTASQDAVGMSQEAAAGGVQSFFKNGAGAVTEGTRINSLVAGTLYYNRLEFTDTNLRLNVFTDSARTIHFTGSPQNQTLTAGSITGLTHLQHGSVAPAGGGNPYEIDNSAGVFVETLLATNVRDDPANPTTAIWRSNSENNPWVQVDMNAIMPISAVAINLDRTTTTATTIKIKTSKDGITFTDRRLRNVSDYVDDTWKYNGFEVANARFVRVESQQAASVLSINEITVRKFSTAEQLGDYDAIHTHKNISATDATLPDQGY